MRAFFVALAFLVTLAAPSFARLPVPKPDAKGCTAIKAVEAYNKEQGWVIIHLSKAQTVKLLTAMGMDSVSVTKFGAGSLARYHPELDKVHDAAQKAELAEGFKNTIMFALTRQGCFVGVYPLDAQGVMHLLFGQSV